MDARFLPTDRTVTWPEFIQLALRYRLVASADGCPDLLQDLLRDGAVRVTGSVPNVFVRRPATPEPPKFTSNGYGEPELLSALQTIERLRRENAQLRARLEAMTGDGR